MSKNLNPFVIVALIVNYFEIIINYFNVVYFHGKSNVGHRAKFKFIVGIKPLILTMDGQGLGIYRVAVGQELLFHACNKTFYPCRQSSTVKQI